MVDAKARRFWRNSPADAILLAITLTQFTGTIVLAALTPDALWPRLASAALVTAMMTYSIIVVTHLFVHQPWFTDNRLNSLLSAISSANIAQSVQAYHLTHVRNHHRYNNDRKRDGTTADITSTFRYGREGEHARLWWYLVRGLAGSAQEWALTWVMLGRGCAVGRRETTLLSLAARHPERRAAELRQIRWDRLGLLAFTALLAVLSWQWTLLCYLPSVALAFTLVNIQNYYRHFGAEPESRYANSVSHYGRLYNLLTFNDGYHQEHHLRPATHWSRLPEVAQEYQEQFEEAGRVVSPVPALVGFLDTGRAARTSRPASRRGRSGT
ncbi:fatty acid desaturase family protein [Streptomyces nigra]|uniref:fatty acid desaturase family protein n=1 Tax=Streptomyces TaxID=1883 RepID=UPI000D527FB6|nr:MULTISPECIES: fatty acid desaturase [Streptomyces]AWE52921.1 fatty acid desaturase [Streptomyces nigra]MCF2535712.1 fatty acid desaturase [Streptomyces sp. FB2]